MKKKAPIKKPKLTIKDKALIEKATKKAEKKESPNHSNWREDYRKKKLGL